MYLVTGATGNAGSAVVRALMDAGKPVKALVRSASRSAVPAGAEVVIGDLNRPSSFGAALAGVDGLFLLSGYERLDELLGAARHHGVARVVLLSSSAAPNGDLGNAIGRYHILSERAVRESGVPWTFLRPNSFMSNTFQWRSQLRAGDVITGPFAGVPISTIDPVDVAAVAVKALVSGELEGHKLRLSGPEALLPADRVRILGAALRRELRFEALTNEQARAEMLATMPEKYVDAFFEFFVDGTIDESTVLSTVEDVLGRAPGTFEQWVARHVEAFRLVNATEKSSPSGPR